MGLAHALTSPASDDAALVAVLEGGRGGLGRLVERSGLPWAEARFPAQARGVLHQRQVGVVLVRAGENTEDCIATLRTLKREAPGVPVVLCGRARDPALVVSAIRHGAADFVSEEADPRRLADVLGSYLRSRESGPVCESAGARKSFELAARVARTDVSVLITGESGTGKEVVARHIHDSSNRAHGPFVGVNCAAIPEHMMEAILFGHEKGAFTGAHQTRPGKFELAEGGTLLLDEISEMGLDLQAKLLRVLQEREVERIGAHGSRPVDVRVIATSNRDLRKAVADGRFREDLYYRLSVFPLHLQPLRERVEDILPLAESFLRNHGARMGRPHLALSDASRRVLLAHAWGGNVRELENAVQRALVLAEDDLVEPVHLQLEGPSAASEQAPVLESKVRDVEEIAIAQALASCNGRRKDAARVLGISERTLRYKMQRLREREEVMS